MDSVECLMTNTTLYALLGEWGTVPSCSVTYNKLLTQSKKGKCMVGEGAHSDKLSPDNDFITKKQWNKMSVFYTITPLLRLYRE